MFAKIGPGANTICRRPVVGSSCTRSVPVMSDGIRSGVNWMRENFRSSTRAIVWISSVLASPGAPTIRLLPPTNSVISTCVDDLVLADDDLPQLGDDLLRGPRSSVGKRDVVRRLRDRRRRSPWVRVSLIGIRLRLGMASASTSFGRANLARLQREVGHQLFELAGVASPASMLSFSSRSASTRRSSSRRSR